MYCFYLNKLLKLFILLKEIIMLIKTHIKVILNMYKLFSKFCCRKKEITCDGKLKKYNTKTYEPKIEFKKSQ